jgi:hypothetical protein
MISPALLQGNTQVRFLGQAPDYAGPAGGVVQQTCHAVGVSSEAPIAWHPNRRKIK